MQLNQLFSYLLLTTSFLFALSRSLLRHRVRSVRIICKYPHVAVVLVTLHNGTQLVVKGCTAERGKIARKQVTALF